MNVFHSIRWRLQAWHGLMLLVVLTAFGFTAYYLVFDNRMRRVDQELQKRAGPFVVFMNRGPGRFRPGEFRPGERRADLERADEFAPLDDGNPAAQELRPPRPPPDDRGGPPDRVEGPRQDSRFDDRRFDQRRPDNLRIPFINNPPIPPESQNLFGTTPNGSYYFAILNAEREEVRRSTNAPASIPLPSNVASFTNAQTRIREGHRELIQATRRGTVIVVGHDISTDLAELNRLAWLLVAAGGGVLVMGLAGGWWLATRAIAPISDISATAVKIADGNLDERINTSSTDNEFGQLAQVLNNTFDRLQTSFARQVQFTADASHELRTPVSVILSQTQSTLKRPRTPEEYRETIESCQRSAARMRQLIESLLALARLDSGDVSDDHTSCELDRVVHDSVGLLRSISAEQDIRLETNLSPVRCLGNAGQLAQVVTNLISNAIYYNKPGGEVRVSLSMSGSNACLEVSDTGIGIAPDDLPHVFERFYRADKSRSHAQGRTGLGLAITKAIVERHHGSISVNSQPGIGSTFVVLLPGQPSPGSPQWVAEQKEPAGAIG